VFLSELEKKERVAAKLKRILIVDPSPKSSSFLGSLLRDSLRSRVFTATTVETGYALAKSAAANLIFVEHPVSGLDGYTLVRMLRRSELSCRKSPIIMITGEATATAIAKARSAGLHEFMRKPYTTGELQRRLEAVTLHPREWIEGVSYVGPDRRRFNAADYEGTRKRAVDHIARREPGSPEERLLQALKIVRTATSAAPSDLAQVKRSIAAQTDEIRSNPAAPARLSMMAAGLADWISGVEILDQSVGLELSNRLDAMVGFLPNDQPI